MEVIQEVEGHMGAVQEGNMEVVQEGEMVQGAAVQEEHKN